MLGTCGALGLTPRDIDVVSNGLRISSKAVKDLEKKIHQKYEDLYNLRNLDNFTRLKTDMTSGKSYDIYLGERT